MKAAMADGVDVRGYFHWTLVDDWEWNDGFRQMLALVAMDRSTFVRGYVYGEIAQGRA